MHEGFALRGAESALQTPARRGEPNRAGRSESVPLRAIAV